ncbi:hypothetical protein HDZ31DRAFT_42045 [Schizophyllum fasciatum]
MPFLDLPSEIVDQILYALPTNDLFHVALVNSQLGAPASRVLYRDIDEPTPRASIRCLHTLASSSHLALLVRSLCIDWASFDRAACVTANAYRLLRRALSRTTRLVRLALELPPAQDPVWVLFEATFQLRAFESTFAPGHALAAFLTSQPYITELGIRTRGASLPLPAFALPRLTHLRAAHAAPGLLADVIAGRPVSAVSLPLYAGQAASAALEAISLSAARIMKFTAVAFDARPPQDMLGDIAARAPHLRALHLIAFLGQYDPKSLLESADTLRQLPELEFITCMAASSVITTENEEMQIATAWRASCPKLRAVILPRGKMLLFQLDLQRWSTLDEAEEKSKIGIDDALPGRRVVSGR